MADGQPKCPECGATSIHNSAVPGLVACEHCGKLFAAPKIEEPDAEQPDEQDATRELVEGQMAEVDTEMIVPDKIEVETGWRAWGVKKTTHPGEIPLLRSVTHREAFWTPRAPMQAICPNSTGRANGVQRKGHEVPDEGCGCGLYSAKTYEHLMTMSYHRYDAERNGLYHAVGKVKVWGKVIEGSQGWRSEFGYPEELYVPFEAWQLCAPLEEAYGVSVKLKNILTRGRE